MNTPAHLIIAAAVLAHPDKPKSLWAAILGGFFPDASLYLMAGVSLFVLGIEPEIVFGQLYFSPIWQQIFAIDNSFLIWGALALACWFWRWGNGLIFALAGLSHLVLDFPLHHDDARAHFWPLSDWVFQSPVSYWDNMHYGDIISLLELALVVVLTALLWRRYTPPPRHGGIWQARARWIFIALCAMQVTPFIIFGLMLSN